MLPVALLIAAGVICKRRLQVDAKPLAKLSLYIFSPALVFSSMANSSLSGNQVIRLSVGTVLLICLLTLTIGLISRLLRLPASTSSAMQLGSVFMNVGNFGLPVILSVCGTRGLERAVIIVVTHQVLMFSLAVYFAARSRFSVLTAATQVLRMPAGYAALVGVAVREANLVVPGVLAKPITLLAQASIPIFLLLLGIQLASVLVSRKPLPLLLGTIVKLAISPMIASILAHGLRLDPVSQQSLILAAATPTAVVTTMLAIEFDAEPQLVSSLTLVTTMLGMGTVPVVARLLGLASCL